MPFDTRDASRNKAAPPLEIRLVAGNSTKTSARVDKNGARVRTAPIAR